MRIFLSSTLNRLVLAYALGLLLAFTLIGGLSFAALDQVIERDTRQTVLTDHKDLLAELRVTGRAGLARAIDNCV